MAWFTSDFNTFFKDLARNNNKEWFDANRKRYEASMKQPFESFTTEVIKRVAKHDKSVKIGPKEAIFRINRDIRFSKDKTPYKTGVIGRRFTRRPEGPCHAGHLFRAGT